MALPPQYLQALLSATNGTQLEVLFSELRQLAVPRVNVHLTQADEELPTATSKIGGFPDVPTDFVWRTHNDVPLAFIGQFRLDELATFDSRLPKTGLLSIFCDYTGTMWGHEPEDKTGWHVEIFPLEGLEQRLPDPDDDDEIYCDFSECSLEFLAGFDLPDTSELETDLSDEQSEEYRKITHTETHFFGLGRTTLGERGVPSQVCELMDLPEKNISLLLRLGSEYQAGMNWGDADWLEFYIPTDDLERGDFQRVWAYVVI